jgi:hypothetical protein
MHMAGRRLRLNKFDRRTAARRRVARPMKNRAAVLERRARGVGRNRLILGAGAVLA